GSVGIIDSTEAGSYRAAGGTYAEASSFTGTVVCLGPSLVVYGTVSFAPATGGPVTLTTGTLSLYPYSHASLAGTDSFVANGMLTLSVSGDLSVPAVDAYGGLTIDGTTGYVPTIHGTTLNNYGAATVETGFGSSLALYQGATINNQANASFTLTGPGGGIIDQDNSAVVFHNAGTL